MSHDVVLEPPGGLIAQLHTRGSFSRIVRASSKGNTSTLEGGACEQRCDQCFKIGFMTVSNGF